MEKALQIELEYRKSIGCKRLSVAEFTARFSELGYCLDRSLDCRATARYLHNDRTYPCCTVYVVEADTGLSFANVKARTDGKFRALQQLRQDIFAVSRGAILEA
jgi:hypothetical protein